MNAPIETASRSLIFEQVENRDEALDADSEWVAASIEGDKAPSTASCLQPVSLIFDIEGLNVVLGIVCQSAQQ